jgi:protein-L-isoaspartate(D-aspartate) O-methyltransferase
MNTTTTGASPGQLRARMVDTIVGARPASAEVEAAMRSVPRHSFVPQAPIEDAYAEMAVITKRSHDGQHLSCASVPSLVAVMLDKLDVQPGHRIDGRIETGQRAWAAAGGLSR